jgi:hypothetical protein
MATRITQVAAARIGQGPEATQAVTEAVVGLRTLRARLLRTTKSVITRKERRSILCDRIKWSKTAVGDAASVGVMKVKRDRTVRCDDRKPGGKPRTPLTSVEYRTGADDEGRNRAR